jgi:acetyl-CoA carboxylase carboxyltransferase component
MVTIVLRKSYGLGAQAMMGGSTKAPLACVAWPTGEFGGMGLEGAVRLGYRNELEAIDDPVQREATFQQMVDRMYEHGKAIGQLAVLGTGSKESAAAVAQQIVDAFADLRRHKAVTANLGKLSSSNKR